MYQPTLAAFRETLLFPEGRFRTLGTPVCERDARGEPRFATGGSAVVFRADVAGRTYALKGYLHPRPQAERLYACLDRYPSALRYPTRYLSGEIYLYVTDRGAWYDLLATEWAEGQTLEYEMRRAAHYRSAERFAALAQAFEAMAAELIAQPWAHGDLKPSNIIVTPQDTLRLLDYDGAYLPELSGEAAVETGTPACNHPLRGDRYDKHIDDYPIALIAASLRALAAHPNPTWTAGAEALPFLPERQLEGRDAAYRTALQLAEAQHDERLLRWLRCLSAPTPVLDELPDLLSAAPHPNR